VGLGLPTNIKDIDGQELHHLNLNRLEILMGDPDPVRSGGVRNFYLVEGYYSQGCLGSPSEVHGRSPGRGSWGLTQGAEAVCRHCLQILTAETIKI